MCLTTTQHNNYRCSDTACHTPELMYTYMAILQYYMYAERTKSCLDAEAI